jgi:hypothetical protein
MGDVVTLATREIMWNIPQSFKIIMYSMLVVSLGVFLKGMYEKFMFVTKGQGVKGLNGLLPEELNWTKFLHTSFLTGKVPRFKYVGFFHSLIFYGFIILWIATDLVAIHYDTPFKVFQGNTYIIISFLADIAGLMILVGLGFAYHRRYIVRPSYLSASKPKQELFMYGMLVSLVVIGYLIEGLRILGTGMPVGEAGWSPVGWLLASLFGNLGMTDIFMAYSYRTLWMLHMLNTMVFIMSLGYSKFSHIFLLPLEALVTPPRRGAVLMPMNFENENAETFGLGKLSELSMKNNFDLLSCVECGRCTQVCPANLS